MIESQERLREKVPGFTFNLGFSGYYFLSGNANENLGDKALIGKFCPSDITIILFL